MPSTESFDLAAEQTTAAHTTSPAKPIARFNAESRAAAPASSPTPKTGFLTVPRELRNSIYHLAFGSDFDPLPRGYTDFGSDNIRLCSPRTRRPHPANFILTVNAGARNFVRLRQLSRQLHAEASAAFWEGHWQTVVLGIPGEIPQQRYLGDCSCQLMIPYARHVRLVIYADAHPSQSFFIHLTMNQTGDGCAVRWCEDLCARYSEDAIEAEARRMDMLTGEVRAWIGESLARSGTAGLTRGLLENLIVFVVQKLLESKARLLEWDLTPPRL